MNENEITQGEIQGEAEKQAEVAQEASPKVQAEAVEDNEGIEPVG